LFLYCKIELESKSQKDIPGRRAMFSFAGVASPLFLLCLFFFFFFGAEDKVGDGRDVMGCDEKQCNGMYSI